MLHTPSDPRGRRGIFYVRAAVVLFFTFPLDTELYHLYNTVNNRTIRVIQFCREEARHMISFEAFRQTDGTPIYLQIIRYIQQGLAAGTIQDGDELPSRRVVSALLAVNPNTVQKAFKQLEDEGLVTSRAGAKSCIQVTPEQIAALRRELLETEMQAMVDAAKRLGLTREEAHRLLDALYDKEGTDA